MADRIGVDGVDDSAALAAATGLAGTGAAATAAGAALFTLGAAGVAATLAGALAATALATGAGALTALFTGAAFSATGFAAGLALVLTDLFTDWVTGLAAGLAAALATADLAIACLALECAAGLTTDLGVGLAEGFDGLLTATGFFFAAAALLAAGLLVCFCVLAGFFAGIVLSPPSMRYGPLKLINWPIIHTHAASYSAFTKVVALMLIYVARMVQARECGAC